MPTDHEKQWCQARQTTVKTREWCVLPVRHRGAHRWEPVSERKPPPPVLPTDREKRLEEAARAVCLYHRGAKIAVCTCAPVFAALAKADSDARREEREADCRAVCSGCRMAADNPGEGLEAAVNARGDMWFHRGGVLIPQPRYCDGSPIRASHPEPKDMSAEEIAEKILSEPPCPAEAHVHEGEGGMIHHPWDVEPSRGKEPR